MKTNINELITALQTLNPVVFDEIKNKNTDKILEKGVILGNENEENNDFLYRTEICLKSNIEVIKKCDLEFPKIKRRVIANKRFTLLSQIITTVSSATIITTLVNNPNNTKIALLFGSISLLGSIIPAINEYIITGMNNKKLSESLEELVSSKISIENMNKELDYILYSKRIDENKISEIINFCNEKTAIINRLIILS